MRQTDTIQRTLKQMARLNCRMAADGLIRPTCCASRRPDKRSAIRRYGKD
ncbi:hypothetical protein CKO_01945 [Citrobacter koseri ATCC BAA-895]|uniref:Uncharacterized protein n=1 Tax=Citrobacter koseri (strain ATCC BAA-895 / CDC 4225-83 / SGSC4696) TaxID=290338 RepID=A8AHV9_CITK8|nr:hypothetical protein CKO_01945 [Citrobacter koseri ATCC BAA-895]